LLGISTKGRIEPGSFTHPTGGEGGSRVDAAICVRGHSVVLIETKLVADLDGDQLVRHADEWGIALPPFALGRDSLALPDQWQLCSWPAIYRWAREQLAEWPREPCSFLLSQFCEYLDLTGVAPYRGLRREHFDFFSLPPAKRDTQQEAELKTRLRGLWEVIEERLSQQERDQLGDIRVANLKVTDEAAAAFGDLGSGNVNLTLEFGVQELQLNLVGWNLEQATRLEAWLLHGQENLDVLDGYELVAWARRAVRSKAGNPYWQLTTQEELERVGLDNMSPSELARQLGMIHHQLEPRWEKLAFHLRRSFPRDQVIAAAEEIVPLLAVEVRRLLPVVTEVNGMP
jgi:hypothetical protein